MDRHRSVPVLRNEEIFFKNLDFIFCGNRATTRAQIIFGTIYFIFGPPLVLFLLRYNL